MAFEILTLVQGTPEWHAHRANHFNASDAPAMMGCSSYTTRDQLLHRLHTGISEEVSSATQAVFDAGHLFESLARPIAAKIIGEDLYPVTATNGRSSASLDGLNMSETTSFEHKTLNDRLCEAMFEGCTGTDLPLEYQVQMEHQMMVADTCERTLFMASKWKRNPDVPEDQDGAYELVEQRHCWYEPNLQLRAQIVAGWDQLDNDLTAYVPPAPAPAKLVGHTRERLPALRIEARGEVTASNLVEFKGKAVDVLQSINTELSTDQQFADADTDSTFCREVAATAKQTRATIIGNMKSVDEAMAVLEWIEAEFNKKGLALEKLVKQRKDEIKAEINAEGVNGLREHIAMLNNGLAQAFMPAVPADFGTAIKNKRTVESLRNAVNTELARAKIEASRIAEVIRTNLATVPEELSHLFPDLRTLCLKACDDFAAVVAMRKAEAERAEAARLEAERERIRSEELAAAQAAQALSRVAAMPPPATAQAQASAPAEQAPAPARAAAISPAPAAPAPVAQVVRVQPQQIVDDGSRLNLGAINEQLKFMKVDAAQLAALGFAPAETVKGSKLYRACDLPVIAAKLIEHLQTLTTETTPF